MKSQQKRPNYGIDAPRMGLIIVVLVIAIIITGFFCEQVIMKLQNLLQVLFFL